MSKETNVNVSSGLGGIFWILNLVYSFMYWGFWWGLLNIFIPFAMVFDFVKKIGKIE